MENPADQTPLFTMERRLRALIVSLIIFYYIVCLHHFRQTIIFENEARMRLENNVNNFYQAPHNSKFVLELPCLKCRHFSSSHNAQRSWLRQLVYPKMRSSLAVGSVWGRITFSPQTIRARVRLKAYRDLLEEFTLVWSAFGAHPSAIAAFTVTQENEL